MVDHYVGLAIGGEAGAVVAAHRSCILCTSEIHVPGISFECTGLLLI